MSGGSRFLYGIAKLNSSNYQIWKYKVEFLLISEGIWDVIAEPRPGVPDEAWIRKDDQARAAIGLLVEDSQLIHIRQAKNALDAWNSLRDIHQKGSLSTKVFLLKRICRLTLEEGGNMELHINLMMELVDKLSAMGEVLNNQLIVAMLLSSLPDSYGTLITALESRDEKELTMELVKAKLLDEYGRRKGVSKTRDEESDTAMRASASHHHKGQPGHSGNSANLVKKKQCYFCKEPGHYKKFCRKYQAWKCNKERANAVTDGYSENQVDETCFMTQTNVETDLCHEVSVCFGLQIRQQKDVWVIDSGATSHMVNNKDFFKEFHRNTNGNVRLANGQKAEIKGTGSGVVKFVNGANKDINIKIDNVLFVPNLEVNLLSVRKLTAKGFKVLFKDNVCDIVEGQKVRATAKQVAGLYELQTVPVQADNKACIAIKGGHSTQCQHMWHRRFGHREVAAIKDLQNKGLAAGIKVTDCGIRETCEVCIKGKMARKPFPKRSENRSNKILDLVHTDVCGPMQTVTPGGKRYALTIIDDYSRYCRVFLMAQKSEVAELIKQFVEKMKTSLGKKPKIIRSDRGKEYVNKELKNYLKMEGIQIQYTVAYTPEQNGVAERKNRSLLESARCMLYDADMDKKYWGEAINTANYLQNRLPSKCIEKTPFELWHLKAPNVDHLRVFGCRAYAHVPKELRRKLDEKAVEFLFVGYSEESKGYRLLDKNTNKIKISRDVVFLNDQEVKQPLKENKTIKSKDPSNKVQITLNWRRSKENKTTACLQNLENAVQENQENFKEPVEVLQEIEDKNEDKEEPRRSDRSNKGVPPHRYTGDEKLYTMVSFNEDPKNRKEALSGPNSKEWGAAMDEEINSLLSNNTWELVQKPEGRDIISCKWVFKTKRDAAGSINKYKARLVARGFSQKYGVDYDEIFAPVVRHTTFRLLLTIAGKEGLFIAHYDAKTAFLNGVLKETIFMRQPEGYLEPDKEEMVCKLNKSIYGLKQAAKAWNDELNIVLKGHQFNQSQADPCLYIKTEEGKVIYIVVYVDDFLIASSDKRLVKQTAEFFKNHFALMDLGELKHYLGIQVNKDDDGFYRINQTHYICKLLVRFGLQDAKTSNYPLDPQYNKSRIKEQEAMKDGEKYQQLIGALLYISVNTRPDITASVCILSQYNKSPTDPDWVEAKRVARYLKGTKELTLKLGNKDDPNKHLYGYSDADWAQSNENRKSNSGHLFKFNGSPISWGCKKQNCIALSTMEAEYIALAEACQEGVWIRRLLGDFGQNQDQATIMYEDNQSCLKYISNSKFSNRTKHIDTKYHFLKDLKKQNLMCFEYCATEYMLADMFTKPLSTLKLEAMRKACNLF